MDGIPSHLHPPTHSEYHIVVDTSGVHFVTIHYCQCPDADTPYLQLIMAGLYPATIQRPRTVFTFQVLDDFIRDNLECGTSGMNYFSKLRRITSAVFPHAVPVLGQLICHNVLLIPHDRIDIETCSVLQGNGDCSNCLSGGDSVTVPMLRNKDNWYCSVRHVLNPGPIANPVMSGN